MFSMPTNRPKPKMRPGAYDTFQIESPYSTHYDEVDCETAECGAYAKGWVTVVDESLDLGQRQAYYIRRESGRSFKESLNPHGLTEFAFRPGQPCFATHRKRKTDRPEDYYKRHGDYRRYLGQPTRYDRPDQWVEDFQTNQDKLKTQIERG